MADKPKSPRDRDDDVTKPILAGLGALVGVAVVVGVLAGLVVMVGSRVVGLGGDSSASADGGGEGGASLYMPPLEETSEASGPLHTLFSTGSPDESEASPTDTITKKKKPKKKPITLSASPATVSGSQELYLSGTYPNGEGATLNIEMKVGDAAWTEFTFVDANVSGRQFSTYVYTSQTGDIQWRMWDKAKNVRSNPVTIKHTG